MSQAAPSPAIPTVGVIYNPRSHRNQGQDLDSNPAPHVFISQPGDQSQLPVALKRFKDRGIDLLVINGGDGTVRDCLTAAYGVFGAKGKDWPTVAVLPKGKTNALTVDLGAPKQWSLQGAIDAYRDGERVVRSPLIITPENTKKAKSQLGFIMGAGVFTHAISAGQDAHRLGAFNALAVGVTTVWTMVQAALGSASNRWRRGSAMQIDVTWGGDAPITEPMPHSGLGDPDWRQFLFASTLESFPAGLKPFGKHISGLKMAVLDQASRRTIFRIPMIMTGKDMRDHSQRGIHQLACDSFTIELKDEFILDGEAYAGGKYRIEPGPALEFVKPASP
ncbi:MAG: diacylglycerol kinase family protein [Erythrobacter sp.]